MTKLLQAGSLVAAILGAHAASADPVATGIQASAREPAFSINADPFGIISGYYGGNFEWLHGAHGLLLEASYFHKGDDATSIGGASASAGYRWHWRGQQNSGFIGLNVRADVGSAAATVDNSMGTSMTYDLSVRTIAITADLGKRWQLDNGLNFTFRLGGGWANRSVSTSSSDPDAQKAAKDTQDLLAFLPIALDGELSLGYSF